MESTGAGNDSASLFQFPAVEEEYPEIKQSVVADKRENKIILAVGACVVFVLMATAVGAAITFFMAEAISSSVPPQKNTNQSVPYEFPSSSHSGYLKVNSSNLFFWFWESADGNVSAPVVLWLQGGPGSSSMIAFFRENGPYHIVNTKSKKQDFHVIGSNSLALEENPYSWHSRAHVLWIDNPAGTGFSFVDKEGLFVNTSEEAADYLYSGLLQFFQKFPLYAKNQFFLFGESYAGKFIPALAYKTYQAQSNGGKDHFVGSPVNLKGFGIGDSFVDPVVQVATLASEARERGFISEEEREALDSMATAVGHFVVANDSATATTLRSKMYDIILKKGNVKNVYDIRQHRSYNYSDIEAFLRLPEVERALDIDPNHPYNGIRNGAVGDSMIDDIMASQRWKFPILLQNFRALLYQGDMDLRDSVQSNTAWMNKIQWSGATGFAQTQYKPFVVKGVQKKAGKYRTFGPLTQMVVHDAGHLAPMDQPKVTLEMFQRFIGGHGFS